MHIIWTILIGFVAGLVAKMLTPGRDPSGFFITAAIGIAGSLIATYVGQASAGIRPANRRASSVLSSGRSFYWSFTT